MLITAMLICCSLPRYASMTPLVCGENLTRPEPCCKKHIRGKPGRTQHPPAVVYLGICVTESEWGQGCFQIVKAPLSFGTVEPYAANRRMNRGPYQAGTYR